MDCNFNIIAELIKCNAQYLLNYPRGWILLGLSLTFYREDGPKFQTP